MTKSLGIALSLTTVALVLLMVPRAQAAICAEDVFATWAEWRLRRQAIESVRPQCPSQFVDVVPLVTVARVSVALDGTVSTAAVVDGPPNEIAAELRRALSKWRFALPESYSASRTFVSGTLTYYFVNGSDGCRALSPEEAPQFADWPNRLAPRSWTDATPTKERR
jgi:hypothetical protein